MARTLWRHDEQTEGKHLVLRSYLDGWFPILSRWNRRLLFVDGFPTGEYIRRAGLAPSRTRLYQEPQTSGSA